MDCLLSTSEGERSAVDLHARLARYLAAYSDRDPDRIPIARCLLLASQPCVVLCFSGIESRAERRRLVGAANEFSAEVGGGLFQTPHRERVKARSPVLTAALHLHSDFRPPAVVEPNWVRRVRELVHHWLAGLIDSEQSPPIYLVDSGGREIRVGMSDISESNLTAALSVASGIRFRCDSADLVTSLSFSFTQLPTVTINLVSCSDAYPVDMVVEWISSVSFDDRIETSYLIVTIPDELTGGFLGWPEIGGNLLLPSGERFDSSPESAGSIPQSALLLQPNSQSPHELFDRGALENWLRRQFSQLS
jgi:hypothetical protein